MGLDALKTRDQSTGGTPIWQAAHRNEDRDGRQMSPD
jgi:hypothetical protein